MAALQVNSQELSISRSTLSIAGASRTIPGKSQTTVLQQSIGQNGVIGIFRNEAIELRQGFIQPLFLQKQVPEQNNKGITVWPNPFIYDVNIKFNRKPAGNPELSVYDITGKVIHTEILPASESANINLSFLPGGLYILKIRDNNLLCYSKIMKY
jgi:hypothetical protein